MPGYLRWIWLSRANRSPRGARSVFLFNESDGQRIGVKLAVGRLYRSDDDQDQLGNQESRQENESDQHKTEDTGHNEINGHGELEIDRLLAMSIDEWHRFLLDEPDDQGSGQVAE